MDYALTALPGANNVGLESSIVLFEWPARSVTGEGHATAG